MSDRDASANAIPADLTAALSSAGLVAAFDAFPSSHRAEYLTWIAEAKKPETRARRIEKTLEATREKRVRNA